MEGSCSSDEGIKADGDCSIRIFVSDDVKLDHIPKGDMLDSCHSKGKASVMRRSASGRRKPTRQGLRDSLLKSLDESDFNKLSVSSNKDSMAEEENSDPFPADHTSTPKSITVPRHRKHVNLNADLSSDLRLRQRRTSPSHLSVRQEEVGEEMEEHDHSGQQSSMRQINDLVISDMRDAQKEIRADFDNDKQTNKLKVTQLMPDVVPPRKLPDLALNAVNASEGAIDRHTVTGVSPGLRYSSPPEILPKPKLRTAPRRDISSNEEDQPLSNFWANRLSKVDTSSTEEQTPEQTNSHWKPKLRKVEHFNKSYVSTDSSAPPKLRPLSFRHSQKGLDVGERSGPKESDTVLSLPQESVACSSLPSKSITVPVRTSVRVSRLRPMSTMNQERTSSGDSNGQYDTPWVTTLRTVSDEPKLRQPPSSISSTPDWVQQASEKRKRASLLLEQAEANQAESCGDTNIENGRGAPLVRLLQTNIARRGSSSSSTGSTDLSASKHESEQTVIPAWKRELKNNSRRSADRYNKTKSCIEMATPNYNKENRVGNSEPSWRKELKSSSGGLTVGAKGNSSTGQEPSSSAEPEFIRLFKKRQERLKKTGSVIIESDC